jgi:hypothetical protein
MKLVVLFYLFILFPAGNPSGGGRDNNPPKK